MDESLAWLQQALSDRLAAERFVGGEDSTQWCHAIAKYQQTVEKAVKAIVAALRDRGVLNVEIGYRHEVERFVSALVRLPRTGTSTEIAGHLSRLLDQNTRAAIHSLEALIPKQPSQGELHRRNTEYPFQDSISQWTFPAAEGVFSLSEIESFRVLAHRIADLAGRIIQTVRRKPK